MDAWKWQHKNLRYICQRFACKALILVPYILEALTRQLPIVEIEFNAFILGFEFSIFGFYQDKLQIRSMCMVCKKL